MYDPEEEELSNTASHLQDRIGESEDMELDDLDGPEPTATDDLTSSTTFSEQQSTAPLPPAPPLPPPPLPPASGLYDDADEDENIHIPSDSNQVCGVVLRAYFYLMIFQEQSNNTTTTVPPAVAATGEGMTNEKPSKRRSGKTPEPVCHNP
jgi:hypothetical protein